LANTFLARKTNNMIVVWTDADSQNQNHTRRNILEIGSQAIILHGDFVPWISKIQQIIAGSPNLTSLTADQLAAFFATQIRDPKYSIPNFLGIVIAGFLNGSASLLGITTLGTPTTVTYQTLVIDGNLPASIGNYLLSVSETIPDNLDNGIDILLMTASVYNKVGTISQLKFLSGHAVVILSKNQNPYWVPDAEIEKREAHNLRRLQSLQLNLSGQIKGLIR
jgi:hypothetical protein